MPPESPSQKRKRGRAKGSAAHTSMIASQSTSASQDGQSEETSKPAKRGRRAGEKDDEVVALRDKTSTQRAAGRRGRPPTQDATLERPTQRSSGQNKEAQEENEDAVPPRRSKRDRASLEGAKPWWEVGGAADTSLSEPARKEGPPQQPKKRGRRSLADVPVAEAQNKGKRGRPSQTNEKKEDAAPRKRRGRPSLADQQRMEEKSASQAKPRGRPRAPDGSQREVTPQKSHPQGMASAEDHPRKRRRISQQHQVDDSRILEAEQGDASKFRQLVPRIRHIPRATIAAKWGPLETAAISMVGSLLAEAERPVLLRLRDSQNRREHARAALAIVSRRVRSKLSKGMPFPPSSSRSRSTAAGLRSGHEDDLDFERIVDTIQSLERTLTPLLHSVALLSQEKGREEQTLEQDYAALRTLEANARSEARSWRERIKRAHALAPETRPSDTEVHADPDQRVTDQPGGMATESLFKNLPDDDLLSVSKQLANHMDSMKSNLQQIDGVVPAIMTSRAALQQVLHKHLDAQQYERVLFG